MMLENRSLELLQVKHINNLAKKNINCGDYLLYKKITSQELDVNNSGIFILKNNQNELVEATLKGICKYFNINYQEPKKETVKTDSTASNTYYRVIAGSYTSRTNADKLVSELKSKGYSAFIDVYKK